MNELSGKQNRLSDQEVIQLGFCPGCGCPESTVENTKKVSFTQLKTVSGQKRRFARVRVIRYRRCVECQKRFRTTEEVR